MVNKKAIALQTLAYIVLYSFAIAMVLLVIPTILNAAGESTQDGACRMSVLARGNLVIDLSVRDPIVGLPVGTINYERITPLLCNERAIGLIDAPKVNGLSDREYVKSQIADLMGSCWEQFAEGRITRLFAEDGSRDFYCHVCSSFRIPRDMNNGTELQLEEESMRFINEIRQPDFILAEEMYAFLRQTPSSYPRFTSMRDNYFGLAYIMEELSYLNYGDEPAYINLRTIGNNDRFKELLAEESLLILSEEEVLSPDTKSKIATLGQKLILNNRGSLAVIIGDNTLRTRADARNLIERMGLNSQGRYDAILILVDINSGTIRIHLGKEHNFYLTDYDINQMLMQEFQMVSNLNLNSNNGLDRNLYRFLERLDNALFPEILEEWKDIQGSYLAYLAGSSQEHFPLISHINASQSYVVAYMSDESSDNFWLSVSNSWVRRNLPLVGALCFFPGVGWGVCGVALAVSVSTATVNYVTEDSIERRVDEFLESLTNHIVVMPSNELRNFCEVVS